MNAVTLTVSANGRVVIPARIRAELGLRSGEKVVARVSDGALVLEPVAVAIKRAQALIQRRAGSGPSPVDELLAERRQAAAVG
jgi:AbrB family looped-hinge helix DNA binding protein